ncbi:hypothetical protein PHMEG_00015239 [Phytophthora megakarya]|uniref:Uncharacterized protein n=1 Tax=Phytophthora megakarya TaxID=4795 RepID=A0A225W1V6_9STRA|nr:hypothetical protein PHMEG_00015239 [Phytophthora megakarya]
MVDTPRLERKNAFRIIDNGAASTRPQPCHPSFTARMFNFLFNLKPQSDETRPKSWSGQSQPATTATSSLVRHVSAKAIISSGPNSSSQVTRKTRTIREEPGDEDETCNTSWHQRQIHCVNCERLFFVFLSPISCAAGRFCSLDCKTNFEYVRHLSDLLAEQMLEASATSSDLGTSSDEEYHVEELDLDQL